MTQQAALDLDRGDVLATADNDILEAISDFDEPEDQPRFHLPQAHVRHAVPTLAVLAAFNATPVRFVGLANLRIKECDRVAALATELSRFSPGLAVEEADDLMVTPTSAASFRAARIHTYSDHRIAMSMALVGLRVPGVTILDPGCAGKTYPDYWRDFASLGVVLE